MLVKLTGEQVSAYWIDMVKPAIANSLPAHVDMAEDTMNNVLAQILSDKLQCWAVMLDGNIVGICTTMVTDDPVTQTRSLLIYSLYNFTDTEYPEDLWLNCMAQMQKVAQSYNAYPIYCYTDNEQIVERAKQNGGAFSQHVITFT